LGDIVEEEEKTSVLAGWKPVFIITTLILGFVSICLFVSVLERGTYRAFMIFLSRLILHILTD